MEEAAEADRVNIIDYKEIIAEGTNCDLKARYSNDTLKLALHEPHQVTGVLKDQGFDFVNMQGVLHIDVKNSWQGYSLLKRFEGRFSSFEMVYGSMDDVFVNITGRRIREDG